MSRPVFIAGAVACIAALLCWNTGRYFLLPAILLALLVLFLTRKSFKARDGGEAFLCDRCKYNDARYCSRPERPNATRCPDFKGR